MASAVTGTGNLAAAPTAYSGANSQLTQAIQTIWSKEILFQSRSEEHTSELQSH